MDPAAQPFLEASYVRHVGGSGGIEVPTWICLGQKDVDVEVRVEVLIREIVGAGEFFLEPSDNRGSIWGLRLDTGLT